MADMLRTSDYCPYRDPSSSSIHWRPCSAQNGTTVPSLALRQLPDDVQANISLLGYNHNWSETNFPLLKNSIDLKTYLYMKAYDPYFNHPSSLRVGLIIMSSIGAVLLIAPIIMLWRNRNVPAFQLSVFMLYFCIVNIINPLIWPTDDAMTWYSGVGFCDVQVRIQGYMSAGIGGNLVCILWSLANALDVSKTVSLTTRQLRLKRFMERMLCFGLPILVSISCYFAQSTRYGIMTISGCFIIEVDSIATLFIYDIWTLVFLAPALYLAILTLIRLYRYHRQFQSLVSTSTHKTKQRFVRLLLLALFFVLVYIPLQILVFVTKIRGSTFSTPYSFKESHNDNWTVPMYVPSWGTLGLGFWIQAACPYITFAFFGTGGDANVVYRRIAIAIGLGRCFRKKNKGTSTGVRTMDSDKTMTPLRAAEEGRNAIRGRSDDCDNVSLMSYGRPPHTKHDFRIGAQSPVTTIDRSDCGGSMRAYNPYLSGFTHLNNSRRSSLIQSPAQWEHVPLDTSRFSEDNHG